MKSRISVECSQLNEDETDWVEAVIIIERPDLPEDHEEAFQVIEMTKAEFEAVYTGMKIGHDQGIWTSRTVEE